MRFEPLLEKNKIPDFLIRWGARRMTSARLKEITSYSAEEHQQYLTQYIEDLTKQPIAINTAEANDQHYEIPTEFFQHVLGTHMKYSCGYWNNPVPFKELKDHLSDAEEAMLKLTCQRAEIEDGQNILDLGCGWGSLALYMAKKYPSANIWALSNSATQKSYIDAKAKEESLENLTVITEDINDFTTEVRFHRVISIEMFEHMRNYEQLMNKISEFLLLRGRLFVHIFTHRTTPYAYEVRSDNDWMTRHFFLGGTMPSRDLLHYFTDRFSLERQWAISGIHYQKTLEAWLQRMDEQKDIIMPIMAEIEGEDEALKWWVYWRVFFMACAEFFSFHDGDEWFISHYLFEKNMLIS
ncbi:SAM-dependent methyltransferase [Isachenkonia alkalipeptolytica]|uniref:Class I SAM-dependent methyltransferase n=1 Tax=Isachenkonia alkalipeptolytica TaxID=2565777 RepID=A0AA44BDJ5_9CLOT|nr:class I SAM-dependent methyltransferase [Isachenkonia alkalipeptolytica]NBG87195.1 class I SAM-dependent methyltransferase [Isachenkonia alkalipeptolytica]